jgi:saccharopine dehydrogenase (NAD+, L-lysine-forming)
VRILVVGTGGVGSAFARIATRRPFFEACALADYDPARPQGLLRDLDDGRFSAHAIDASSRDSIVTLIRETRADAVLNSVDPLFNMPIFDACFEAGVTYLDMAMSLSRPHPERPYEETYVSSATSSSSGRTPGRRKCRSGPQPSSEGRRMSGVD